MKVVNGVYTSAKIFTDTIEEYALAQIQMLCDQEAFSGCRVRVMPDVHPGKVGTIGFTSTVKDRILPNVVGIDIGCGLLAAKLKEKKIDGRKLDTVIRDRVPAGSRIRKTEHRFIEEIWLSDLKCYRHISGKKAGLSLGTLGGGNHFIEVDRDEEGFLYAVIHSGSRHLGKEVTEYYLKEGQKHLKKKGIQAPYELIYLEGTLMEDYIHDLQIVQEYAKLNRAAVLDELVKGMKWKTEDTISSVHNYIEDGKDERILRKGAISARAGESLIVPVNMRDGILLGEGLGNADWNYSGPHGAGRIMKREDVKQKFTVSQFKSEMKGIYCTCVDKDTLDEAPFAYRGIEEITKQIADTMEIQKVLKPVYCFKAGRR